MPQRLVEELRAAKLPVLSPFLNQSVKIRESHQVNRPLVDMAPSHKLAGQFGELFERIEDRVADSETVPA